MEEEEEEEEVEVEEVVVGWGVVEGREVVEGRFWEVVVEVEREGLDIVLWGVWREGEGGCGCGCGWGGEFCWWVVDGGGRRVVWWLEGGRARRDPIFTRARLSYVGCHKSQQIKYESTVDHKETPSLFPSSQANIS